MTSSFQVTDLTFPDLQKILRQILSVFPKIASFILRNRQEPPPSPDPSQEGQPSWCKCSRCTQMPTEEEQVCCRTKVGPCILVTAASDIRTVVLDRRVLAAAVNCRNDLFALRDDINSHRTLRHTAYRQYVLWKFGRLGAGNRVVIPSCVVTKIRNNYPEPSGIYTGFRSGRFN